MNGNGKEYALALFSIALENENIEVIHSDLCSVKEAVDSNPEYLEYLINPAVPKSERIENLGVVFEGRVCEDVFAFLNVICEHGDLYALHTVFEEFDSMYQDYMKYAKAVITSAVELSDEQKAKLLAKLSRVTKKRIEAEYIIDKNLMGGITVEVDGKFYDGSVRKNLKNIKEEIS